MWRHCQKWSQVSHLLWWTKMGYISFVSIFLSRNRHLDTPPEVIVSVALWWLYGWYEKEVTLWVSCDHHFWIVLWCHHALWCVIKLCLNETSQLTGIWRFYWEIIMSASLWPDDLNFLDTWVLVTKNPTWWLYNTVSKWRSHESLHVTYVIRGLFTKQKSSWFFQLSDQMRMSHKSKK